MERLAGDATVEGTSVTEILEPYEIDRLRTALRDCRTPYIRLSLADELLEALVSHERLRAMFEEAVAQIAGQSPAQKS